MEVVATLLLIITYGLAGYLAWTRRTLIYIFAMLAGHVAVLVAPLWQLLYAFSYNSDLATIAVPFNQRLPLALVLASGWFYPLPALVVFYLFSIRWWFPGRLTGMLTYLVFLLYHLLIETLGLRITTWSYAGGGLPMRFSMPLFSALMGGLVSYGFLYVIIASHRFSWQSMLLALLPSVLGLSLLIYGLLGAPLWLALLLGGETWAQAAGLLVSLILLAWAGQIITDGISRCSAH